MGDSAYERARRFSNWDYGQKYNGAGEFNPRLSQCADCGEYKEPEELNEVSNGVTVCSSCMNDGDYRGKVRSH